MNLTLGTKTENSNLNSTLGGKEKLQLALPHELVRQRPRDPRNSWRRAPRHPGIGGGGEVEGKPKWQRSATAERLLTVLRAIFSVNSSLSAHKIWKTERLRPDNHFKFFKIILKFIQGYLKRFKTAFLKINLRNPSRIFQGYTVQGEGQEESRPPF